MTRAMWRRLVLRDDWHRISDDERARRVEAAVTPREREAV